VVEHPGGGQQSAADEQNGQQTDRDRFLVYEVPQPTEHGEEIEPGLPAWLWNVARQAQRGLHRDGRQTGKPEVMMARRTRHLFAGILVAIFEVLSA
jgi:hypothetical protein